MTKKGLFASVLVFLACTSVLQGAVQETKITKVLPSEMLMEIAKHKILNEPDLIKAIEEYENLKYTSKVFKKFLTEHQQIKNKLNIRIKKVLAPYDKKKFPLHKAVAAKDLLAIHLLIKSKAKVNAQDANLETPLHIASGLDNKPIVDLLISNNANLEMKNESGETPLHIAVSTNKQKIAKTLIDNGANLFAVDNVGKTPLIHAIEYVRDAHDVNPKAIEILQFIENEIRKKKIEKKK